MLDINQQAKIDKKMPFPSILIIECSAMASWIFLAALDFQPDGLMDMQASRLKIASAAICRTVSSDQLGYGKFIWLRAACSSASL